MPQLNLTDFVVSTGVLRDDQLVTLEVQDMLVPHGALPQTDLKLAPESAVELAYHLLAAAAAALTPDRVEVIPAYDIRPGDKIQTLPLPLPTGPVMPTIMTVDETWLGAYQLAHISGHSGGPAWDNAVPSDGDYEQLIMPTDAPVLRLSAQPSTKPGWDLPDGEPQRRAAEQFTATHTCEDGPNCG